MTDATIAQLASTIADTALRAAVDTLATRSVDLRSLDPERLLALVRSETKAVTVAVWDGSGEEAFLATFKQAGAAAATLYLEAA